jgi:hypothetical protein
MTLLCLEAGARVGEIPLNYKPRVGASMGTPTLGSAVRVGARMVALITAFRLRTWFRARRATASRGERGTPLPHERV